MTYSTTSRKERAFSHYTDLALFTGLGGIAWIRIIRWIDIDTGLTSYSYPGRGKDALSFPIDIVRKLAL